jgi:hypothetical protein
MFQKTVTMVAIIILILTLGFIGLALYRQKYNPQYPPVIPNCPDYWDASGNECVNFKKLGNSQCFNNMDFTTAQWSGDLGLCGKYKWAKGCNLSWDGISNRPELCD